MGKAISRCFLLSQPSFSELEVVQKTVVVGHVGEQQGNFIWKAQHVSPFFIHLFRTKATAATAIICYCYLLHIKQRVIQMLYFLCNLDKKFAFLLFWVLFRKQFFTLCPLLFCYPTVFEKHWKKSHYSSNETFSGNFTIVYANRKSIITTAFPFVWFVPKMYFDGLVGIGPKC